VDFACLSWWRAWIAAHNAGDQPGVARAEVASRDIQELLTSGTSLQCAGRHAVSVETLSDFRRLDAQARGGDLDGLIDWSTYQAVSVDGLGTGGK
jgi:hypothetical protein